MMNITSANKYLFILMTCVLVSCTHHTPPMDGGVQLNELLHTFIDKGTMVGHQDDLIYGNAWFNEEGASDIKKISGDYPAIAGFNISKIETGSVMNIDSIPFSLIKQKVVEAYRNHIIVTINWNADIAANYPEQLDRLSDFLLELRNDKGELIPIIFHPFISFYQKEKWLSLPPETYKNVWRETVDYLKNKKNMHHILYAWSAYAPVTATELSMFYPGDEYVDIVGVDLFFCYSSDPQGEEYKSDLDGALSEAKSFAVKQGKMLALTSTGLEGIKIPDYFTGCLYPVVSKYKLSYILFGRNAWNKEEHYHIPAQGHPSRDDFVEFAAKPDIFLLNDIKKQYN